MTDRVRLLDSVTGEVLAEGVRPAPPIEAAAARCERDAYDEAVARLGPPPPITFDPAHPPTSFRWVPGETRWIAEAVYE